MEKRIIFNIRDTLKNKTPVLINRSFSYNIKISFRKGDKKYETHVFGKIQEVEEGGCDLSALQRQVRKGYR